MQTTKNLPTVTGNFKCSTLTMIQNSPCLIRLSNVPKTYDYVSFQSLALYTANRNFNACRSTSACKKLTT